MKLLINTLIVSLVCFIAAGCSDVGFESIPKLSCSDVSRDQNTTCVNSPNTVTVSFTFGAGEVDILFVDDNSGSMFVEQEKMANAFQNFISNISNLFYQIAIITTDVSASAGNNVAKSANGNGAFQDGKFLEFTDESGNKSGKYIIDQDTANADSLFRGTIKRYETLYCDGSGFQKAYCPSDDERGIYALNQAIVRGNSKFFRPGAHAAFVILADEDERSHGGLNGGLPLEPNDLPETLVANMKKYYPTKSFSVHSIVTNNETCRQQQTQTSSSGIWPTYGVIGQQYMKLSSPSQALLDFGNIMYGTVGSICLSNYASQLSSISDHIKTNTLDAPKQLACTPNPGSTRLVTNPPGYESQIGTIIDDQNKAYFYNLPLGVKVTFSYDCEKY